MPIKLSIDDVLDHHVCSIVACSCRIHMVPSLSSMEMTIVSRTFRHLKSQKDLHLPLRTYDPLDVHRPWMNEYLRPSLSSHISIFTSRFSGDGVLCFPRHALHSLAISSCSCWHDTSLDVSFFLNTSCSCHTSRESRSIAFAGLVTMTLSVFREGLVCTRLMTSVRSCFFVMLLEEDDSR